jgi:hypothetical protein
MRTIIAQSTKLNPKEAVLELKTKFNSSNIKAITFFASSIYNPAELISAMNGNFPDIHTFGCSTAGEIVAGSMISNSIVAMAFTDEIIEDIKIEVVNNISSNLDLQPNFKAFEDYYNTPFYKLDNSKYFGLVYIDGLSKAEEKLLDTLGDHTNVMFVGGSAGDDLKFAKTIIYANGKYYDNAAALVLIKSKVEFGFEKIQSFTTTEHTVVATKVDETNRIIYELNNKPAAEVYASILNTTIPELQNYFSKYALGLIVDEQPYIRSIQQIIYNTALLAYCNILEGTKLTIMKTSDMITDTNKFCEDIKKKYKSISGILLFNCILRTLELQNQNKIVEYANLFSDVPIIGFNTYGEAYIGHINQTATFLVLE